MLEQVHLLHIQDKERRYLIWFGYVQLRPVEALMWIRDKLEVGV